MPVGSDPQRKIPYADLGVWRRQLGTPSAPADPANLEAPDQRSPLTKGQTRAILVLRCTGNHCTRLSDKVRQVECWFSHITLIALLAIDLDRGPLW